MINGKIQKFCHTFKNKVMMFGDVLDEAPEIGDKNDDQRNLKQMSS